MKLPINEKPTYVEVLATKRQLRFFARLFYFTPFIFFPLFSWYYSDWTFLWGLALYFIGAVFRSFKALSILAVVTVAIYFWRSDFKVNLGFTYYVAVAFWGRQAFNMVVKWKTIADQTEENFNIYAEDAMNKIIEDGNERRNENS